MNKDDAISHSLEAESGGFALLRVSKEFPIGIRFLEQGGCVVALYLKKPPPWINVWLAEPDSHCGDPLVLQMAKAIVQSLQSHLEMGGDDNQAPPSNVSQITTPTTVSTGQCQ